MRKTKGDDWIGIVLNVEKGVDDARGSLQRFSHQPVVLTRTCLYLWAPQVREVGWTFKRWDY